MEKDQRSDCSGYEVECSINMIVQHMRVMSNVCESDGADTRQSLMQQRKLRRGGWR